MHLQVLSAVIENQSTLFHLFTMPWQLLRKSSASIYLKRRGPKAKLTPLDVSFRHSTTLILSTTTNQFRQSLSTGFSTNDTFVTGSTFSLCTSNEPHRPSPPTMTRHSYSSSHANDTPPSHKSVSSSHTHTPGVDALRI
mmetsp:Transcript_62149/g.73612  ORF Transcript_62149/g.73612 Transcript_62149/m.73612 type:complete len:139 (+) Transcript_62149:151-567(+)